MHKELRKEPAHTTISYPRMLAVSILSGKSEQRYPKVCSSWRLFVKQSPGLPKSSICLGVHQHVFDGRSRENTAPRQESNRISMIEPGHLAMAEPSVSVTGCRLFYQASIRAPKKETNSNLCAV